MLFTAGIDKDFLGIARGAEAYAAQSPNPETRATFMKVAKAYRELAREKDSRQLGFPSLGSACGSSKNLPLIWVGPACFGGLPANDAKLSLIRG